jgi:hypothetical protein
MVLLRNVLVEYKRVQKMLEKIQASNKFQLLF